MRALLSIATPSLERGMSVTLNNGQEISVGSSRWADLVIEDSTLSGLQFQISMLPTECWLRDLRTSTGTFVNGTRVTATEIQDGDVVHAGETSFTISLISDKTTVIATDLVPCEFRLPADVLVQCSMTSLPNDLFRLSSDRVPFRTIALECIPWGLGVLTIAGAVASELQEMGRCVSIADGLIWLNVSPEILDDCLSEFWEHHDSLWFVGPVTEDAVAWLGGQTGQVNQSAFVRNKLSIFPSTWADTFFDQFLGLLSHDDSLSMGWAIDSRLRSDSLRSKESLRPSRKKGKTSSVA